MSDLTLDLASCREHGDEIAGRYQLGPALRTTAHGCTHRAYDELLQRDVSLTLVEAGGETSDTLALPEQSWQGREPDAAELFDGGRERDRVFYVTHHPETPTLAETTPPAGLPAVGVRDLGVAVATALLPLHRQGRGHGGLGASTISWSPHGATFSDVGLLPWLARWSDLDVAPPFPAPEQDGSATGSGPATDVYALGRLLREVSPPQGLHRDVRSLLTDMTSASPEARPGLEEVLRRLGAGPARPRRLRTALTPGPRGRRVAAVAAACAVLAAGLGLGAAATSTASGATEDGAAVVAGDAGVPGVPLLPEMPAAPPDRDGSGAAGSSAGAGAEADSDGGGDDGAGEVRVPSGRTGVTTASDDEGGAHGGQGSSHRASSWSPPRTSESSESSEPSEPSKTSEPSSGDDDHRDGTEDRRNQEADDDGSSREQASDRDEDRDDRDRAGLLGRLVDRLDGDSGRDADRGSDDRQHRDHRSPERTD
ncbi:hypothetical protein WCD74_09115 [Actinomycetospora sp. OC33-EN08]|uniref:Protein kinase domain-containing protein n=1 Tax=Actinomycetospora aurantiaca TaxID=3129233 RepID=A0ABU8MNC2_9PSEU